MMSARREILIMNSQVSQNRITTRLPSILQGYSIFIDYKVVFRAGPFKIPKIPLCFQISSDVEIQ